MIEAAPFLSMLDLPLDENKMNHEAVSNAGSIQLPLQQVPSFPLFDVSFGNPLDPQDIYEYEPNIYCQMRNEENNDVDDHLAPQSFSSSERGCLIDWICRLNFKCQLSSTTFFVAVKIIDKVMKITSVPKDNLLLVGCAAMLIASKSEDVVPLIIDQILQVAEKRVQRQDLIKMELSIFEMIGYHLTFPTSYVYLYLFFRLNQQSRESILFSKYIIELCMTSSDFIFVKPSAIAAAAIVITRLIGGAVPWTPELQLYTQYSFQDLLPHVHTIHQMLLQENRLESCFIKKKYSSDPYLNIAKVEIPAHLSFVD